MTDNPSASAKSQPLRQLPTAKGRELAIKTARELVARLIETNALSPAGLPEALSLVAKTGRAVLAYDMPGGAPTLKLAKEICLKLIERRRLNSPQATASNLAQLGLLIAGAARNLPAGTFWLLGEAKELTIKMIESNRLTREHLDEFFLATLAALKTELEL